MVVGTYVCPSDDSQPYVLPNWGWAGSCYASNFQVFGNSTDAIGYADCCDAAGVALWQGEKRMRALRRRHVEYASVCREVGQLQSDGPLRNKAILARRFKRCHAFGVLGWARLLATGFRRFYIGVDIDVPKHAGAVDLSRPLQSDAGVNAASGHDERLLR